MNHQTISWQLNLGVICASLLLSFYSIGQDLETEKWDLGLSVSPNFAYQQRSTPRNRAIQMRPFFGFDFGVSISRNWKSNFVRFIPSYGYTRNKTRSSLAHEGLNVKYLFGSYESRLQTTLLYGKNIPVNESTSLEWSFGVSSGYGFFQDSYFEDVDYTNEEKRIREYYVCASSGLGMLKKLDRFTYYFGFQINQGLLSYTNVSITLDQYSGEFLSKGSSLSIVNIFYLKSGSSKE